MSIETREDARRLVAPIVEAIKENTMALGCLESDIVRITTALDKIGHKLETLIQVARV